MKICLNNKEIKLVIAETFLERLKGLMFKTHIDYCLRLKTNSIHTFFMKEAIDVVMTNQNNQVLYYIKNVPKNQLVIRKKVYYTYEFPINFLKTIKKGDFLTLKDDK